jgi:hypothetical protein
MLLRELLCEARMAKAGCDGGVPGVKTEVEASIFLDRSPVLSYGIRPAHTCNRPWVTDRAVPRERGRDGAGIGRQRDGLPTHRRRTAQRAGVAIENEDEFRWWSTVTLLTYFEELAGGAGSPAAD